MKKIPAVKFLLPSPLIKYRSKRTTALIISFYLTRNPLKHIHPETSPLKTASNPVCTNVITTLVHSFVHLYKAASWAEEGQMVLIQWGKQAYHKDIHTVGRREGVYTLESKIIWQVLSKVTSALCWLCGAIQSCLKHLVLTFYQTAPNQEVSTCCKISRHLKNN